MIYSRNVRKKAINLRKKGYSIKEIAQKMGIATSTSSVWVRNTTLDRSANNRIKKRRLQGQINATKKKKILKYKLQSIIKQETNLTLKNIVFDKHIYQLICALLFWAEGTKNFKNLTFTNSDPKMMHVFITLLRKSFSLDESKFRCLVHIHNYHNDEAVKLFWSKLTGIPLSQFNKSYTKPHTGKNYHPGYKGCLRLTYYDYTLALKLKSLYNNFI